MNCPAFLSKSLALLSVLCLHQLASAELVIMPIRPIQDLILVPGTPFNNSNDEVLVADIMVEGIMYFDSLAQVGTTIELVNGRFFGEGFDARFGGALSLTTGTGDFTPMSGVLEDVVRDPNHPGFPSGALASIVSANMTFVVPNYGVRLSDLNVDLEVRDPFVFRAQLDGVPASNGTMYFADPLLGDASRLEVYLAGTNTLIGYSTNRRLVAVPEPSSLFALTLVAGLICTRRRLRAPLA